MKSCFFIGHRDAPEDIFPVLELVVEQHIIQLGVTEFIVGSYGRFDSLAAAAVRAAKKRYPQIVLLRLIPYHPAERPVVLPQGFDGTFYPPGMETVPHKLAIVRANRYMVDHTDCLIAYVWHTASNAAQLLAYAKKREQRGKLIITQVPAALR